MKSIWITLSLVVSFQAGAESGIHSISRGENGEPHLVKMKSGEVRFIEQGQEKLLSPFESKIKMTPKNFDHENKYLALPLEEYVPTPVADSEIQNIWNRMNPFMKRKSECSDRAHVWAHDEFQKTGTKSEKAFLLLTDSYIRRHRYKWWFHVAPMYTTASGRKIVMDYQFLDRPVTYTEWKNLLVFSKRECVTEFRFLDYNAGADQSQDCYQKFEPMYYYVPADIANFETGRGKSGWSTFEVNGSRSRAFFKGSN